MREEKERIEKEREEKKAWHMEELRRMGYYLDPGSPRVMRDMFPGDIQGMKKPPRY